MPFDVLEPRCSASNAAVDLPITAAAAIAGIAEDPTLATPRKRDLLSALNTAVRLTGLPATNLVLSPSELRQRLLRHSSGFGLSSSRWGSIKSALRHVLRQYGLITAKDVPVDPAWQTLLGGVGDAKRRGNLMELARYASSLGIAPGDVDDAVFAGFLVHLTERTLNPNPRKLAGAARSLWNRCHATQPAWQGRRIAGLQRPGQFALPLSCFPAGFAAAVAAHCARSGADPLIDRFEADDDSAEAAAMAFRPGGRTTARLTTALRPTTIATRRDHLRWAASALVASGVPIGQVTSLAALVTPWSHARAIVRFLHARAEGKPSTTAMHGVEVLRIIAKYEADVPPEQLEELGRWRKRVAVPYTGITRRNRQLVTSLLEPARERALLQLPGALLAAAEVLRAKDPPGAALLAQRGLAIRILTSIPLRLKNLIGLRLDQHLQRPDPRRRLITHIEIPGEEAKGDEPLLMHVSPEVSDVINQWIDRFRPALASNDCPYLFPGYGTGSRSITPQGLREAIKTATARHVGVAVNPHAFRHLAAARYLQAYPDGMEAVSQLLGHASAVTTRRHYAIINNRQVFERFDALAKPRRVATPSTSTATTGSSPLPAHKPTRQRFASASPAMRRPS